MNIRLIAAAVGLGSLLLVNAQPAAAIGCISGGLAGAIAGHAVHHGVMGAVGGCIAGHEYHKHQLNSERRREQSDVDQTAPGNPDQGGSTMAHTE